MEVTSPRSCAASYLSARRPERSCERLVAQDSKGRERDGNLDDDRADRQELISRMVCVSIDYPTPRDTDRRSRPTGEKRQYRRAARFPGASRRPAWESVQKSRILHKTIDVDFKGDILCINDVRK
jgi:hypothetical protein